jgi:hypothetical protein
MQFNIAAIGAFETGGQSALKGQAASLAKGRFDKAHLLPATRANEPFRGSGAFLAAELAGVWINETKRGVAEGFERRAHFFI